MTREEAITNVRSFLGQLTEECQESIRALVPELKESESEKIRKKCIELIKRVIPSGDSHSPESKEILDCIAYLEKQKEPKHAPDYLQKVFEAGQKSIVTNPELYGLCKKTAWSEEDKKMLTGIIERGSSQVPPYNTALRKEQVEWLMNRFKPLYFQHRDYAITFWTYLGEHRPEGKMCLSNGECADIEKAFIEHDWAKILRYAKKYLSPREFKEGDKIIEYKVGMHGEPIKIVLDKYAQRARGIFPGDELMVILRTKR